MVHARVGFYALMLATAGIPLYIHLPRFASVNLGIGLGTVGAILLLIRLIDLIQDPLIGWIIDRWPKAQSMFAMAAAVGLAIGFPLLFTRTAEGIVNLELVVILILLFSAYSLGMILLYGRAATFAKTQNRSDMMTLAAFREMGMLAGVIIAAIAPSIFVALGCAGGGYPAFGWFLGAIAVSTAVITRPIWHRAPILGDCFSMSDLASGGALRLLILALINSMPVAITSTLFLFFVEDRLHLVGKSGPLLILFFLCAGISVPIWARVSSGIGGRNTLLIAMPLTIAGFVYAGFLNAGDIVGFSIICVVSGIGLGADMVVLPAMFSVSLNRAGIKASQAFGIWSFAGKLGLALSAFIVLPLLEFNGFKPGQANTASALATLNIAYAVVPCFLKLIAFGFALMLPTEDEIS
ncbi:sugar:cation symporter [Amylibacter ulvae]|uniref:Sugar:cation symporter n=1 Tax=Paramylibacter ulvae TaxID=1651968 RepID=A0ABQ3CUE6_9RHOB|nr:MFS transporter [Amylibacter ulvae]GHA44381.1 sugar:cation symporter [Amylibacter ulvae]